MLITIVQQMGVFSMPSIPWAEPMRSIVDIAQKINLEIEIINFGCVFVLSPFKRFVGKLAAI